MLQILAVQPVRVKKGRGRFFERDPMLEPIGSGFARVPIEHQLRIYEMLSGRKGGFTGIQGFLSRTIFPEPQAATNPKKA